MRDWVPLTLFVALISVIVCAVAPSALGATSMQGHDMSLEDHAEGADEAGMESSPTHSSAFAGAALWAGLAALVIPAPVLAMKKRFADITKIMIVMLSASAGMMHLLLVPDHPANFAHGTFFVIAGVAQLNFALVFMARQEMKVALAGIIGNIAMIALYLAATMAYLPVPFAGTESIDPLGIITNIIEASLIALLAYYAASLPRREHAKQAMQRQLEVH